MPHAVALRHDRQLLFHRLEYESAFEVRHADPHAVSHPDELLRAQRRVEPSAEPAGTNRNAAREPVPVPVIVGAVLPAGHVEDDLSAFIGRESDLHPCEGSDLGSRPKPVRGPAGVAGLG